MIHDELAKAYEDGIITGHELVAAVIEAVSPDNVSYLMENLDRIFPSDYPEHKAKFHFNVQNYDPTKWISLRGKDLDSRYKAGIDIIRSYIREKQ